MLELIGKAKAQITFNPINPITSGSLEDVLRNVVTWVLFLAGAIAIVYLIYGGILYITAGGDAEKATKGRTAVVNAVIGVIIIMLALVIVQWVMGIIRRGSAA